MRVYAAAQNNFVNYMAKNPIKKNFNNRPEIVKNSNNKAKSFKNGLGIVWDFLKKRMKRQWNFVKSEFSINND